jgi:hypothetical protein
MVLRDDLSRGRDRVGSFFLGRADFVSRDWARLFGATDFFVGRGIYAPSDCWIGRLRRMGVWASFLGAWLGGILSDRFFSF